MVYRVGDFVISNIGKTVPKIAGSGGQGAGSEELGVRNQESGPTGNRQYAKSKSNIN
jgi:hypothetical protein